MNAFWNHCHMAFVLLNDETGKLPAVQRRHELMEAAGCLGSWLSVSLFLRWEHCRF
jgi:hypothetical protein